MTTVWSSMIIDSDPVIATRTSQRFAGAATVSFTPPRLRDQPIRTVPAGARSS